MNRALDLSTFPGGDLVAKGLSDLAAHNFSEEALLVLVAAPKLRSIGLEISETSPHDGLVEHALYALIEARCPEGAHSAYNALISRIVSFAETYSATMRP